MLEDDFGESIFIWTTRRVHLSEFGLALLPFAERALSALTGCSLVIGGAAHGFPKTRVLSGTRCELDLSRILSLVDLVRAERTWIGLTLSLSLSLSLGRVLTSQIGFAILNSIARSLRRACGIQSLIPFDCIQRLTYSSHRGPCDVTFLSRYLSRQANMRSLTLMMRGHCFNIRATPLRPTASNLAHSRGLERVPAIPPRGASARVGVPGTTRWVGVTSSSSRIRKS